MGRKSVAEKVLRHLNGQTRNPRPGQEKLVVYDFKGRRIATEFFRNLERLLRMVGGFRVQYSVVSVRNMRGLRPFKNWLIITGARMSESTPPRR